MLEVLSVAERVTLSFQKEDTLSARVTYSSYLSKSLLAYINDEQLYNLVAVTQSHKDAVTLESYIVFDSDEGVFANLAQHLSDKGFNTVLVFSSADDLRKYESLGFIKVAYLDDVRKYFMTKELNKVSKDLAYALSNDTPIQFTFNREDPYNFSITCFEEMVGTVKHFYSVPSEILDRMENKVEAMKIAEWHKVSSQHLEISYIPELEVVPNVFETLLCCAMNYLQSNGEVKDIKHITVLSRPETQDTLESLGFKKVAEVSELNSVFMTKDLIN